MIAVLAYEIQACRRRCVKRLASNLFGLERLEAEGKKSILKSLSPHRPPSEKPSLAPTIRLFG
jgi:hypothetical protein